MHLILTKEIYTEVLEVVWIYSIHCWRLEVE